MVAARSSSPDSVMRVGSSMDPVGMSMGEEEGGRWYPLGTAIAFVPQPARLHRHRHAHQGRPAVRTPTRGRRWPSVRCWLASPLLLRAELRGWEDALRPVGKPRVMEGHRRGIAAADVRLAGAATLVPLRRPRLWSLAGPCGVVRTRSDEPD